MCVLEPLPLVFQEISEEAENTWITGGFLIPGHERSEKEQYWKKNPEQKQNTKQKIPKQTKKPQEIKKNPYLGVVSHLQNFQWFYFCLMYWCP